MILTIDHVFDCFRLIFAKIYDASLRFPELSTTGAVEKPRPRAYKRSMNSPASLAANNCQV
jgi:hypothetical protein